MSPVDGPDAPGAPEGSNGAPTNGSATNGAAKCAINLSSILEQLRYVFQLATHLAAVRRFDAKFPGQVAA